ncbi:MAG: radical SAM protein [Fusobacteriaceae bacterium]|jgi:histone acetyltransferase (RNA polymerase elongator complex component)|nr:radical SAM protein [Fusobacteriaceae bacterium]
MRHYNIPIFINHYGCPGSCIFCEQKKMNGVVTDMTPEEIRNILQSRLATIPAGNDVELAFFGGTFTGLPRDIQERFLETVRPWIENGALRGIRLSTRPDRITPENLDLLKYYGVTAIELGVQSLDPLVLQKCRRFYTAETVRQAAERIHARGFSLGIQLMPGLPTATFQSDYGSSVQAAAFSPETVRIYPTLVISGTKLEKLARSGEYQPLSLEKSLKISKKIYSFFRIRGITVLRVGLQADPALLKEGVIAGGPFHPAYRELVETEIYSDFLREIHEKEGALSVCVHEKNASPVNGHKGRNKKRFFPNFHLAVDRNLSPDALVINGKKYPKSEIYQYQLDHMTL